MIEKLRMETVPRTWLHDGWLMEQLASQGVAILFVSSELEEVMSMSDRILVMHEGQIMGELDRDQMTEESIMQLATGNVESAISDT